MSKKQEYQLSFWSTMIQERVESGMPVTQWCKDKGLSKHAYYYWLEKLRESHYDEAVRGLSLPAAADAPEARANKGTVEGSFVEIRPPKRTGPVEGCANSADRQAAAVIRMGGIIGIELFQDTPVSFMRQLIMVLSNAQA